MIKRAKKKPLRSIARCDRDAHRARARRLAYRVDVRTHGPIRANGHVALRDLSRDDRDARQSCVRAIRANESYRVSPARGSRSDRSVGVSYLCDARVALEGGSSGDGRLGGDDVRVRERGGGHDDVSVCADARDDGAHEAQSAVCVGAWCVVAFLDIFCVHYGWWEDHHDHDRDRKSRTCSDFDLQQTLHGIATDGTDGAGGLIAEVVRALGAHAQVATREDGGVARLGETDDALVGFGESGGLETVVAIGGRGARGGLYAVNLLEFVRDAANPNFLFRRATGPRGVLVGRRRRRLGVDARRASLEFDVRRLTLDPRS